MTIEQKHFPIEFKEVGDSGEFIGFSSVFSNLDLGGDVVMPGAFAKTISERGGRVPLFYGHRIGVGVATVKETDAGLETHGFLNLEKQASRELSSDLKFWKQNGMSFGMSIGYNTVPGKVDWDGGRRILRELKLHEATLTEVPMNELARVVSLKSIVDEFKAGRRLSAETIAEIDAALQTLQALRNAGAAEGTPGEEAAKSLPPEPVVDHSRAIGLMTGIRSLVA